MATDGASASYLHGVSDVSLMDLTTIAYGMTKARPVSRQVFVDDPVHRRVEAVGRLQPHTGIKIAGRGKDMLIPGNENIFPRAIEGFLYSHPTAEQVEMRRMMAEELARAEAEDA